MSRMRCLESWPRPYYQYGLAVETRLSLEPSCLCLVTQGQSAAEQLPVPILELRTHEKMTQCSLLLVKYLCKYFSDFTLRLMVILEDRQKRWPLEQR